MVPLPQVAPTCSVLDPGGQSVPPASPLLPPGPQTLRLHPGCEALPSSDVPALPCQLCQGHKLLWGGGLAHSNPLPSSGHLAHPTPLRPHGWLPNRSPLPVQGSWPPMSCPASVDSQVTWTRTWGHAESLLTHSSWLQSCLVHLHSAALGAGSLAAACPCPGPLQGPPGGVWRPHPSRASLRTRAGQVAPHPYWRSCLPPARQGCPLVPPAQGLVLSPCLLHTPCAFLAGLAQAQGRWVTEVSPASQGARPVESTAQGALNSEEGDLHPFLEASEVWGLILLRELVTGLHLSVCRFTKRACWKPVSWKTSPVIPSGHMGYAMFVKGSPPPEGFLSHTRGPSD